MRMSFFWVPIIQTSVSLCRKLEGHFEASEMDREDAGKGAATSAETTTRGEIRVFYETEKPGFQMKIKH